MQLIQAQQVLARHGYIPLTAVRSEGRYHEYLYSKGNIFVGLEEALSYSLEGRCNIIHISANLTGNYRDLHQFQQECRLGNGFAPYLGQAQVTDPIDWDMRMSLHPMHGVEALARLLTKVKAFDVRPGAVEMWSSIEGKFQVLLPA